MSDDRPPLPLTMPCPTCRHDGTWTARPAAMGSGTTYAIDCPRCEGRSVQAQMQRRIA